MSAGGGFPKRLKPFDHLDPEWLESRVANFGDLAWANVLPTNGVPGRSSPAKIEEPSPWREWAVRCLEDCDDPP